MLKEDVVEKVAQLARLKLTEEEKGNHRKTTSEYIGVC